MNLFSFSYLMIVVNH